MCVLFSSSYGILGKIYKKIETSQEIELEPVNSRNWFFKNED